MQQTLLAGALENQTENQKTFKRFLNRGQPPYEKILLKYHEKRVLAMLNKKIVPPYEIEIQPSSTCNLNCNHCFGKTLTSKRLENKIKEKQIKTIANRINQYTEGEFKTESIKFCGTTGEPLVNPATLYGISLFKALGKQIVLFTNGLYLDKVYQGKKYLDYLININRINLSLDAGSEKTFLELKGRVGFSRIIKSLEELVEKKHKNLKINISYVIGEKNHQEIIKTAKLTKELGVDELRFRVDFTDPKKIHKLSKKIIPSLNYAKEYSNDKFKVLSSYSDEEIKQDDSAFNSCGKKCFTQHIWACIGPDCELYSCGHRTYFGVKSYGSLLNHSFKDLWTNQKRLENLKNLPDDYCKFCSPFSSRANDFITFLDNLKNQS